MSCNGRPTRAARPTRQLPRTLLAVALLLGLLVVMPGTSTGQGAIVFRVNAGGVGNTLPATPQWTDDTEVSPSPYVNALATGNWTASTSAAIDTSDSSIPAGTPSAIFQTERWDPAGAPELAWDFPVVPGNYEVRLYFAEIFLQTPGARVFDVSIEGTLVLDNYDIVADVGANKGVVKSFVVQSDANLDIDFGHVVDNPKITAVE
ncbi:MAG: hypothetical protein HW413_974, partial [Thermoleophilia bacterium]|nr:hypothetical protein [Thermoleophilia bacterium]